ncbi:MAG: DUF2066 domain-containing protein [Proteobacteria bacterium]|nr:DUF2066 domain-containing protein [Pseudomonadota bacterium]
MSTGRRLSAIFLVFLLAFAAGSGAATAQVTSGNAFTIGGVDVDVQGPDAIKARDQAIREAKRRAVGLLIERMVSAEDRSKVPPLDDTRLEGMIRGVEFAKERSSANRFTGTLNVVFAADKVKAWLSEAGIAVAETVARPALVIPLWKDKNGVEPLDDRNAWRDAWSKLDTSGSSVPVTVLRGDQLDENAMSAEEAYVGDVSALTRLNERYRLPTVIVAIVEGDKESGPLSVGGIRYDTQTGARSDLPRTTVAGAGQLADAAAKIQAKLDADWRGMAVVRRDAPDSMDVVVPIRALSDWVQVRQRLGAVPSVKGVVVRQLESDRADLHIDYFGTPEQLQQTLAQAGLQLARDGDGWRLQVR